MLKTILNELWASPTFREAFDAPGSGVAAAGNGVAAAGSGVATPGSGVMALYDMAQGQRAFYAAAVAEKTGRPVLYITGSESAAMQAADDCGAWLGGGAEVLPAPEIHFTRGTASRENAFRRLSVLQRAQQGKTRVLCVAADTLLTRLMPPESYAKMAVMLETGCRMLPGDLVARLVHMGYERVDMVEGKGQCALRGDIVDVYSPDESMATRIEFFDDEVDSIRPFDPISQRSSDKQETCALYPAVEWVLPQECARQMRILINAQKKRLQGAPVSPELPPIPEDDEDEPAGGEIVQSTYTGGIARLYRDAEALEEGLQLPQYAAWAGALDVRAACVWDYLDNPVILLDSPENVVSRIKDRVAGFAEEFKLILERQEAVPEQGALLLNWEELFTALDNRDTRTMQDFLHGQGTLTPKKVTRFAGVNAPKYVSRFKELSSDILAWKKDGWRVLLMAGGDARGKRLQAALKEMGVKAAMSGESAADAQIGLITLSHGFTLPDEHLAVIADSDLFGAGYHKTRARSTAGEKIEAFTDLKEGDYVVHEAHGVGIFRGTVRLQTEGTYRDYLLIQYQGNDKLYVPVDQFDRVQKFIGGQNSLPPLNSLGGKDWEKQKSKVRAGLKKLAFDLVKLYAERQTTPGHAFSAETLWQREFDDAFPYELTPDQEKAVADIARDMEAPTNMDRLVCGDVGYGKTEVALRAAMKAVSDGMQVALLAPTTILAQQHYYTMLKRFGAFPVNVDVLSRFRGPKAQKETLARLAEGKVDIIVGTHRLLSKDVRFKNLGLLIVDEEQRFGVSHKESIKNMKKQVDVLTLSATPIPRTLHMSMVGVRDMSLLQTPPEERYPVQTYVLDYNDAVIRDAIMREIGREGQVYFLYNQVQHIDAFAARLRALVPEARIVTAHGQMKESLLEDVMLDFYEGRFDVLLCSTIIENGLDVPRANTIIIFDADRFGLSQLYQLRGRVGRSTRVAYAYFTVRPDKMLSETAQKRLAAIREFTAFGSGFRIAMRDLEIRGAGNIFGPEQSGNVAAIGYDMYCRLIEEAVQEARGVMGEKVPVRVETRVDVKVDAYLPGDYVSGETQRMEIFKRIALIKNRADREEVIEEMIDRFGEPPAPVITLIDIAHLRAICERLGLFRVSYTTGTMVFRLHETAAPDPGKLYDAITHVDQRLFLSAGREPAVLLRMPGAKEEDMLPVSIRLMEKLEKALA